VLTHLLLDPGVPDLVALGATAVDDLLGTGAPLEGEAHAEPHAEPLAPGRGVATLRVPLPGTVRGRPRGAGTGWMVVRRYDGAPGRWGARMTAPRSDSHAAREWNLLCALRGAGVVTAAPLAVAAEAHPLFARRSALVTRALEGVVPLEAWWREAALGARRRACAALGMTLARLDAGGFDLPLEVSRLGLLQGGEDHAETAEDACGLEQVLAARRGGTTPDLGLRWRRLPEVVLLDVSGGRVRGGPTLERLARRVGPAGPWTASERRRIVMAATSDAARRRALLA